MSTQFISRMAGCEDRPAIIERITSSEEIASLGLQFDCDEEIKEIVYLGTPLPSCKDYAEKKWLIQIYIRTDHMEFSGFPNGLKSYDQSWIDRYSLEYKMAQFIDAFVKPIIIPSLLLEYTISSPCVANLFYEKVSPASDEHSISVFPKGTVGTLYKVDGEQRTLIEKIDLYHPTTSKADTCFTYGFKEAGVYELEIVDWKTNNNDPGVHDSADFGKGVYSQMLRGSIVTTLSAVKFFSLPSNVGCIYSMFNSSVARGKCPSLKSGSVTRPTDMFDGSMFDEIGDIEFPNAWKTNATDVAPYGQATKMFCSCSNLKKIGNVILPYARSNDDMFKGDSNLEEIGVFDCLKNSTAASNMFSGCSKLSRIKVKSLPEASILVDFSSCPLSPDSMSYMTENVNDGGATIRFSTTTKDLDNYNTFKVALETKGYTVE